MLRTSCVLAENDSKNQCIPTGKVQNPTKYGRSKVRKESWEKGRCEGTFWKKTDRKQVRSILLAAKRFELIKRKPGKRSGPLGAIAIEILELFANLVHFKTGRLEPSIETIMRYLKRSKDAVTRALKALKTYGFLDWIRRYKSCTHEGRGPQIKQVSNAYRLSLPPVAEQLLNTFLGTCPLPDDIQQRIIERSEYIEAHRSELELADKAIFDVGDNALGRALARLAASIKQRESAQRGESQTI